MPVDVSKLNTTKFSKQKNLSAKDYVIICGDFGGVWDRSNEEKYWIKWMISKNFTTLFIDGNHENHQMLNEEFPVIQFCGGNAHKINGKTFHLMRGQVFNINNKKYLQWAEQAHMIKKTEKKEKIGGPKKCHLRKNIKLP